MKILHELELLKIYQIENQYKKKKIHEATPI